MDDATQLWRAERAARECAGGESPGSARRRAQAAAAAAAAAPGQRVAAAAVLLWGGPDDVRRARDLALGALALGSRARRVAAVAEDRLRVLAGRPQKFGLWLATGPDGREVDPATTDSERAKWGVPARAELDRAAAAAIDPAGAEAWLCRWLEEDAAGNRTGPDSAPTGPTPAP